MEKLHTVLKSIYNFIAGFWTVIGIKLFIFCIQSSDEDENFFSTYVLIAILAFIVPMNIDFFRTSENKKYIPFLFFFLSALIYVVFTIGGILNV